MSITPEQCRAARGLLAWSQGQLASAAKVSRATLAEFEAGNRAPYDRTLADIKSALESAGVEFIAKNGGGPGVRLKKGIAKGDPDASLPVEKLNASNDD
jgi:transcriptional regulator with XRE-family HTH domain